MNYSLKSPRLGFALALCLLQALAFAQEPQQPAPEAPKKVVTITREPAAQEMRYKLIPLETLGFETVEAVCRQWLSPGSVLTYEKSRSSILVYDTPAVIAKIEDFVRNADSAPVNIRIDIDYVGAGQDARSNVNVGVKGSPDNPHFRVDADKRSKGTSDFNSMSITTGNGLPASLWVGKTVIDPSWLRAQRLSPFSIVATPNAVIVVPEFSTDFALADVGSKLMVQPFYQEATGNITVELFPVLSFLDGKGRRQNVKVESLSTKVVVKDGARVYIGGAVSSNSEQYSKLFGGGRNNVYGAGSKSSGNVLDMYVTCRAMKLDDPRKSNARPATKSSSEYENPMDNFRR